MEIEIYRHGEPAGLVEYVVFGEGPDEGVDRLLHDAHTGRFVGSTHVPFAEALREVEGETGLPEDLAREAFLTRPRHTDDDWDYLVWSDPVFSGCLRERRPTREAAEERARAVSAALTHAFSSVTDERTMALLADYHRGAARGTPRAPEFA